MMKRTWQNLAAELSVRAKVVNIVVIIKSMGIKKAPQGNEETEHS